MTRFLLLAEPLVGVGVPAGFACSAATVSSRPPISRQPSGSRVLTACVTSLVPVTAWNQISIYSAEKSMSAFRSQTRTALSPL